MRVSTLARNLRHVQEDRSTPRCQESVTLLTGETILCESAAEADFWRGMCEAIRTNALDRRQLQVRELFTYCLRDGHAAVESWNPRYGGASGATMQQLMEADAVGVANFSRIIGQFAYSQVMAAYDRPEFVFSKMIQSRPTNFQFGERIPGISRLGDQSAVVTENGEYPRASLSEDFLDTPATTKRGFIVEWTKELIYHNGTTSGQPLPLMERLTNVGAELAYNKECRLIDAFIDENTTVHRYNRLGRGAIASYSDNSGTHDFDNLQASNALVDWTDVDNARLLFAAMLDPNTGQPISMGMDSMSLVVTEQLRTTANYIRGMTGIELQSGGFATSGNLFKTIAGNPLDLSFNVVCSPLLALRMATDTSWFLGDIAKTVTYLENWPITVVQRGPNSEAEFERDIVGGVKCSEKGVPYVIEPRKTVKSTV